MQMHTSTKALQPFFSHNFRSQRISAADTEKFSSCVFIYSVFTILDPPTWQ